MSPRNFRPLVVRLAVSIALGVAFLWTGAQTAVAGEPSAPAADNESLGKIMPYVIGGTVLLGVVAIAVVVNVAKRAERQANPLAGALPTDMQTEGNPLLRLAIPLLIAGGLAAGLFLVFHDVDNGYDTVKQAVTTPTPAPQTQPLVPTVDPKVIQPGYQVPQIQTQVPAPQIQVPQPPKIPGTH